MRNFSPSGETSVHHPEAAEDILRRLDRAVRRSPVEPVVPPDRDGGRYEDFISNAPIGIYRVSRSGQLLLSNPALVRMLGRASLEDLMSENGSGPFSHTARGRFWSRVEKEQEVKGYESDWGRSDGSTVYLREHARAICDRNQEVLWFEGMLEDISDRRAAEKQLRAEREFTSAVIDTAASLVVILDLEGRVVRFNQACEALSGYSVHEMAGRHLWDVLYPPDQREGVRERFGRLLAGEFPAKHECCWHARNGKVHWIDWSDSALLDQSGSLRHIVSIGIDITDRKATEDALRASERRYRELFESATDVIYRMTLDGRIVQVNAAAEKLTGYKRDQIHDQSQFLTPRQIETTRQLLDARLRGAPSTPYELPIRAADGCTKYLDLMVSIGYEGGKPVEFLGIGRDVTWRKEAEEFERCRRAILEMAARHEPPAAVMCKLTELLQAQFPNSRCTVEMPDLEPGNALPPAAENLPLYEAIREEDPDYAAGYRRRWRMPVISSANCLLGLITLATPRVELPTDMESDRLANVVKQAALTIERHMMIETARWSAQHDKLTGLANRELFEQHLQESIDRSNNGQKPFAVFYADLDRFKIVNYTLGQDVGDSLLKAVAERLSGFLGGRGLVARMGGDEFTILIETIQNRDEADLLGRELLACFETPFAASRQELFVSASVGCSIYPWDGEDAQTLRRNADTAMYRAKESGRNRFMQFAPLMIAGLDRRLKIQNELHRALERRELTLHYQPQHDLNDDRMIGVEALLRWNSRDLGPVSPMEFIRVAEESGLIVEIGTWVLKQACRQCRSWYDAGHPIRVAVNVSAWQFARTDFVETVQTAVLEAGIPPQLLELELTETVLMRGCAEANSDLERLRHLGVEISIDDFGTGYSSLAYLQHLPIHALKIDLSFVRAIRDEESIPPLILAITALARGLNLNVIAEGVEHSYQARVLRRAGCHRIQGYLYGRPVPAEDLSRMLSADCRPSAFVSGRHHALPGVIALAGRDVQAAAPHPDLQLVK